MFYPEEHTESLDFITNFMWRVYSWMAAALTVSAVTAYGIFSNPELFTSLFSHRWLFWVIMFAQLGLVFFLSARILKMSFSTALVSFMAYSFLSGVTFSVIFFVFQMSSIVTVFMVTSAMFAVMAIYGYVTKKDLTQFGQFLIMILFGLIICMLINFFMRSSKLDYLISFISVFVFTGLIAFDVQRLKYMAVALFDRRETANKVALLGSLMLYLDFVNLFISLLNLFGKRRD